MSVEQFRYSLLGSVRAWREDVELQLGWPKRRAVLAMLLLNANRLVTPAALVDGLWGEDVPASAANLIHTYVAGLRRVLEPGRRPRAASRLLVGASSGYVLRVQPGQLDLDEFHARLDRAQACRAAGDLAGAVSAYNGALTLWEAPPLAGVPGPLAQTERARLTELRLTCLEDRADACLELGGHHQLVGELLVLVAEQPLRERISALLMTALQRCGRQAEALAVYARTRSLLAEELGVDPGPELQRLQLRILSGDLALKDASRGSAASGNAGAHVGAKAPVPHQLPAEIPNFVGRVPQLRVLSDALAAADAGRTVPIATIDGMGGIGKSALAIHAAHRLAEAGSFPDGELYVNLRGACTGLAPLDPLDALAQLLRALGVNPSSIPEQLESAAALFRTLTTRRRVLLVLDNARDAAQVGPLLPADPACGVLVTSRQVLATLDAGRHQPVHLDLLSEGEALELLGRLVGRRRAAADAAAAAEVVRWCGYLPLAIRVAAARLAARPGWPVRELAGRLAAAGAAHRLEELVAGRLDVRSSFEVSLHELRHSPDPVDRAAATAFGLLPDAPDLDVTSVAVVLGQPPRVTAELLERLADSQLLQTSLPGRYQFHDLLRLCARQHMPAAVTTKDPAAPSPQDLSCYPVDGVLRLTARVEIPREQAHPP